jgi:hypothetical protein
MDFPCENDSVDAARAVTDKKPLSSRTFERAQLGFQENAIQVFSFLEDMGFRKTKTSPTIVQYERGGINANVFHGRQSYEIEFEIVREGTRYSLSELIRLLAPDEAEVYRNSAATTPGGVNVGLKRLKELVERYAKKPLQAHPAAFLALDRQRRE